MSIQEIRDYQLRMLDKFDRPWLYVAECSQVLGLSDTAIRTAVECGELTGDQYKKRGRYKITKASVRAYIKTSQLSTTI